jgi:hypothetical protein
VYGVDPSWVRAALANGLARTLVFAAACETQGRPDDEAPELVGLLAGSSSGVLGWNILVPWDGSQFLSERIYELLARGWTVRQALDSVRARRAEYLRGSDLSESFLLATDLKYHGSDLRVFEIVTLRDPATTSPGTPGSPLGDGFGLSLLIDGALSDGLDDEITVDAEVVGVTEDLVAGTLLQLELDGVPLGQPQALTPASRVGPNRYRHRFVKTPAGKDLEVDTEYRLAAVVRLPEGGESRYTVRLRDPDRCHWRARYWGSRTGEHQGTFVFHIGTVPPAGMTGVPLETRQIGAAKPDVMAFTLSFGGEALTQGTTGTFTRGIDELANDGYLALDLGEEFMWKNAMTGEQRPFTVHITVNERDRVAGTFRGNLLNVPDRGGPNRPEGDIGVEGSFVWSPGCVPERRP